MKRKFTETLADLKNLYEEMGIEDLEDRDKDGNTSLHMSLKKGKFDVAELLVKHGIDLNAQNLKGNTPLHIAVKEEDIEAVDLLLKNKADPYLLNERDKNPLHKAAKIGNYEIAKLLLDRSYNIKKFFTEGGGQDYTPLHFAAGYGYLDIVKMFIDRGIDVNLLTSGGDTPAVAAFWLPSNYNLEKRGVDSLEVLRFLVERGADINIGEYGITPLLFSIHNKNLESIIFLLKAGAKLSIIFQEEEPLLDILKKSLTEIYSEKKKFLETHPNFSLEKYTAIVKLCYALESCLQVKKLLSIDEISNYKEDILEIISGQFFKIEQKAKNTGYAIKNILEIEPQADIIDLVFKANIGKVKDSLEVLNSFETISNFNQEAISTIKKYIIKEASLKKSNKVLNYLDEIKSVASKDLFPLIEEIKAEQGTLKAITAKAVLNKIIKLSVKNWEAGKEEDLNLEKIFPELTGGSVNAVKYAQALKEIFFKMDCIIYDTQQNEAKESLLEALNFIPNTGEAMVNQDQDHLETEALGVASNVDMDQI
ncbi:MAG: serine/threonine-protein phosphatase 6 regulatory ankyrin repeat subunit A-like [Rickettsiaceae bacterium]|jgi:ankyrin repeat protein|nr:serine/threonine-protein phosphatase 6 regulatory ankyrin repeat subunit A-like [Rickettsiaceae bacterium]